MSYAAASTQSPSASYSRAIAQSSAIFAGSRPVRLDASRPNEWKHQRTKSLSTSAQIFAVSLPVVSDQSQDPRRDDLIATPLLAVGHPVARIDGVVVFQERRREAVRRGDVLHEDATAAGVTIPPAVEPRAHLERDRKIQARRDHQSVPETVEAAVDDPRRQPRIRAEVSRHRREHVGLARLRFDERALEDAVVVAGPAGRRRPRRASS